MHGRSFDLWTHLIAEHFFNPSRSGKHVRLNVTRELLDALGAPHGLSSGQFLGHAARGLSLVPKQGENVCEYAESLFDKWSRQPSLSTDPTTSAPPFIGYLGVFVYVATIEEDAERSYHRNLWARFRITSWTTTPTMYPGFDRMRRLWEALEVWSRKTHDGTRGIFQLLKLGSFPHVSIPWAQAIMTEEERERLPGLFAASELTPQSPAPPARLKQIVNEFGKVCLSGRTRRAVVTGGELEGYVLDDLRRELRAWDGTCRSQFQPTGRAISVPPRSADLVVFLWPRGNQLLARLRFESAIEDEVPAVRYQGENGRSTIVAAPKPGWSDMVKSVDGTEFDGSILDWDRDYTWDGRSSSGPRRLKFAGRTVRIFFLANCFGLGGLVERDQLPASGRCWIASGSTGREGVESWLGRLPPNTFKLKSANLPHKWVLYQIDGVPADPDIRSAFPGGSEDAEPELRLCGGLRVRRGRVNEYHIFAPPRIELAGDRNGVSISVGDVPLVPVDDRGLDGLYELPLTVESGYIQVRAVRAGVSVSEESFTLIDVAHAGGPIQVRGLLDGFGRASANSPGWCGAWVDAPGLPRFDFCSISPPKPTVPVAFKGTPDVSPEFAVGIPPESLPLFETVSMEPLEQPPPEIPDIFPPHAVIFNDPTMAQELAAPTMNALVLHASVMERLTDLELSVARIEAELAQQFSSSPEIESDLIAIVRDFLAKAEALRADARRVCEAAKLTPTWSDRPALLCLLEEAWTSLEEKQSSMAMASLCPVSRAP